MVTMLSWLDLLPDELSRSRPRISLFRAWALLLTGQLEKVEAHLQEAEGQFNPDNAGEANLLGEITTIRAGVAYFSRDMSQAIALYHQALSYLPSDDLYLQGIVMECLGGAYSWTGQMVEATQAFSEGYRISQASDNLPVALIALWSIARLHVERGQLHQGESLYRQTLSQQEKWLAEKKLNPEHLGPIIARVYLSLAELRLEWNDLEGANQHVAAGLELGRQAQESGALVSGYLVLAQIKQAEGDTAGVVEAIQQAEQWLNQRYTGSYYLSTKLTVARIRLGLLQKNLKSVLNLLQERNLQLSPLPEKIPYLQEELYLSWVRVLLAQRQAAEPSLSPEIASSSQLALALLDRIIVAARASERLTRTLEALILEILFLQSQNELEAALATLKEALTLAEPEGYIRLFLQAGPPMAQLLRQALARGFTAHKAYLLKLLAAFEPSPPPSSPAAGLLEPLSDRELELLQLMATGLSNQDIANKLFLTVGTVKWHLNNIYSKLDVRSRTQAVARARELKLL
jgi:LuxR family maltose regulon positive regulatory protein